MGPFSCSIAVNKGGISFDRLFEEVEDEVKGRFVECDTIWSSDCAARMRPIDDYGQILRSALVCNAIA